ncbi:ribosomal protein S6 kinase delta-1 [Neocloeon triangulifer]|uniref:ribosomal protein S6 kinase delta-1 n=1 Tax=Neocloeon triangulifer TaxID=2078957 RepID=UPI00286F7712|nr:ribosomal protein S6 kinase delta-1 [Neocloeon triangulifer]
MAQNNDGWVRRFLVTDPQRHRRGFTVYKVTSVVYPVSSPEAVTKVVVWKRYNDFKKLHRELQSRHEKLYLKGTFPPFSKPSLFGRFEEEVVDERRLAALSILEFAAEHVALFTSQVFVKFFESGYSMNSRVHHKGSPSFMDEAEILSDPILPDSIAKPLPRMSSFDSAESRNETTVWTGQLDDNASISSSFSSDEGGKTSDTESPSTVSSPGRSESSKDLLSFFDPLKQAVAAKFTGRNENNQQLLSSLQINEQQTPVDDGSCHGAGYIFEAACQVSQAQQHEANGHFDGAFESYKLGIGILLSGVQADSDSVRRQVVREKTAKYLIRAEKIYNSYLLNKEDKARRIAQTTYKLLRPIAELNKFKVIGVIGKCMLVRDETLSSDNTSVIKTFWKSPLLTKTAVIIPQEVPYFVQCLNYFETESTIFTVLEFVSYIKLWDQLGDSNVCPNQQAFFKTNYSTQQNSSNTQEIQQNPLSPLSPDNSEGLPPMACDLTEQNDENCNNTEASGVSRNSIKFPWLDMDTSSLVQNAQKLLHSVSATLQKSDVEGEESTARSEKPTVVQYFPKLENSIELKKEAEERSRERLRRSSSRSRSSTTHLPKSGRVIERRFSYDDLLDGRSSLDTSGRRSSKALDMLIKQRLSEDSVRVLASQLVLALEALHEQGIFYGDLNPDNLLLDNEGNIILTFIGKWPCVEQRVDWKAVENMYAAPEIGSIQNVTSVSDWWSLGAIIFELLTGKTLVASHPGGIHSHTILNFPDWISADAKSLLTELLKADQFERLGCGSHGIDNIKAHLFFNNIDWDAVMQYGVRKLSFKR